MGVPQGVAGEQDGIVRGARFAALRKPFDPFPFRFSVQLMKNEEPGALMIFSSDSHGLFKMWKTGTHFQDLSSRTAVDLQFSGHRTTPAAST